jgi:hypothetical protein
MRALARAILFVVFNTAIHPRALTRLTFPAMVFVLRGVLPSGSEGQVPAHDL